ncbi:uncharacterized protein LOC105687468 [Athalia rosae]|uniref:uncharacterized protein LOC105687468 n=1 Tax=Athalia rosae TaxID=37344 RepID=UPI00203461B9|nr:uncharacterized protein LOC105687468 [Athalia rosae]
MEEGDAGLESAILEANWNRLLIILKPKFFPKNEAGQLVNPRIIATMARTLTEPSPDVPEKVKIVFLKCLMNSCVNGYEPKEFDYAESASKEGKNFYEILREIYAKDSVTDAVANKHGYPSFTHFPYEGVAKWATNYISYVLLNHEKQSDDKLEILRLSIQFLCNLCKSPPQCIFDEQFKKTMIVFIQHEHLPVQRAACAFVHNALTLFQEMYYTDFEKDSLTLSLIKPVKLGIPSAIDALKYLLKDPVRLCSIYKDLPTDDRLYLLELIYQELRETGFETSAIKFSSESISFLSNRFKRKSDCVLKTVNSYMDGTEPMEIMILLDILGVLTSITSEDKNFVVTLQNDKSLLINCIFLLKSLHMIGKEGDNFFTPVQRLNELAPSGSIVKDLNGETQNENAARRSGDIQSHPAFGFKAGLIRLIGNMVHKHKGNQELLRETDGIPLLLDSCNMDARNPLIMQWTILAMRNVCENNTANQEVVRGLTKIGVADNNVLREMGITLHDEGSGKSVGIMPLERTCRSEKEAE